MGIIDFGIRITQKIAGDDALGNLQKLEKQMGASERSLGALERRMSDMKGANLEKLDDAKSRLVGLQSQMAKMQSSDSINIKSYERLTSQIASAKAGIEKLTASQNAGQQKMASQIDVARGKLGQLTGAFVEMGGKAKITELEELGKNLSQLQEFAGMAGPIVSAVLAIIGVLTVVVGVAIAAAAALTSFALASADAQRTLGITMAALAGSTAAGEANVAAIERVANSTATAKGQIEDYARKLAIAGIEGERFQTTLKTLADVAAIVGPSAAAHIDSIIERSKALGHFQIQDRALRGLGLSFKDIGEQFGLTEAAFKAAMKTGKIAVEQGVDAINAAVAKRFGGSSAALLLGFNVQLSKARERMAALFKDINVEPFLLALQNILSLLDQNTVVGKALHDFFTVTFDSLGNALARYGPSIKAFFVGFAIGVVQAYIGFLLLKNAIEDAFGTLEEHGIKIDAVEAGILAAQIAVSALAFSIGALGAVVGAVVGPLFAMWAALDFLVTTAVDFGKFIGEGLVNGVQSMVSKFVEAMKNLGTMGLAALNSIFHFGSPSKAMIQRGQWIDEGGAEGVEQGGAMARAMGGMASPADAKPGAVAAAPSGARTVIHIERVEVKGGEGAGRRFLAELADACEEAGISVGWGPEPEPTPA